MTVGTEPVTPGWRLVSIGSEGDTVEIGGIDIWAAEWASTGGQITVAHPSHPEQRHTMVTCEVDGRDGPVPFAAGEFSNGVWGFFEPT